METKNDLIIEQLNQFIDSNKDNLSRVKKDNPSLFNVVSDTLNFLAKRYGGEEGVISEIVTLEEPKIEYEILIKNLSFGESETTSVSHNSSIGYMPSGSVTNYYVSATPVGGDAYLFENQLRNSGIDLTDIQLNSEYSSFAAYGSQQRINELVKAMQDAGMIEESDEFNIEVGDIFYTDERKYLQVESISGGEVYLNWIYDRVNIINFSKQEIKSYLDRRDWIKVATPKVGDVFSSSLRNNNIISKIITPTSKISEIDLEFSYVDINNTIQNVTIRLGDFLDYVRLTNFKLVSTGNDVQNFLKNQLRQASQQSQSKQTKTPIAKPKLKLSFVIGDYLYYASNPKIEYVVNNINPNGDVDIIENYTGAEWTWDAESMQEEIDNGELIIGLPQGQAPTTSQNNLNYKVGDKFKGGSDTEIPPKWVFTITGINKDAVEYSIYYKELNQTDYKLMDRKLWDEDLISGVKVPYIESASATTPQSTPSAQTTSALSIKEQIQQLKDEIDGFQILADIGDEDAANEVKKLKKELKALKSSNK